MLLAKMGCSNITLYDEDSVEDHNVASQLFRNQDIGKNKAEIIGEIAETFSEIALKTMEQEEEENISEGLVIFAIDSMEERIRLGKIFANRDLTIIDGRMGGLQAEVYVRKASDYLPTTVAPESVETDACTAKAISFNCAFIGGMIANYVRLLANEKIDFNKQNEFIFLFDTLTMLKPKN
jgi:molybdopterin/thiamine biosynthesis adenylyltransferase